MNQDTQIRDLEKLLLRQNNRWQFSEDMVLRTFHEELSHYKHLGYFQISSAFRDTVKWYESINKETNDDATEYSVLETWDNPSGRFVND